MHLFASPHFPTTGWQHHPVCNFKYHFIIPAESTLEDMRQLTSVVEAKYTNRLPLSFKWTPPAPEEAHDEEAGPYNAAHSVFESQDHLLHGALHANGYGHLLRMNGSQGGSRRLIGAQHAPHAGASRPLFFSLSGLSTCTL